MISAARVGKVVSGRAVLQDVTLRVERGECVRVQGTRHEEPATLMRILATLIPPTTGIVSIDGLDVGSHRLRARRRMAYVDGTTPGASGIGVGEYIWMMARGRGVAPDAGVVDLLTRAGVAADADLGRLPAALGSVVAMCAALAWRPEVLLLDEALAATSAAARQPLLAAIASARARGAAVVVVAADGDELVSLCGRVVSLENGRLRSSLEPLAQPVEPTCSP